MTYFILSTDSYHVHLCNNYCDKSLYSVSAADKIAIPDFGTGAMENWGLITYRETNLLFDDKESSSINKQRVASVIAHELVHQVTNPITYLMV